MLASIGAKLITMLVDRRRHQPPSPSSVFVHWFLILLLQRLYLRNVTIAFQYRVLFCLFNVKYITRAVSFLIFSNDYLQDYISYRCSFQITCENRGLHHLNCTNQGLFPNSKCSCKWWCLWLKVVVELLAADSPHVTNYVTGQVGQTSYIAHCPS